MRSNQIKLLLLCASFIFAGCSGEIKDPSYITKGSGSLKPGPVVELYSFQVKDFIKGGASYPFQFRSTDSLGFNANKLEYSRDGGVTWELMVSSTGQSATVFPTLSGQLATFNWAVPVEPDCLAGQPVSDSAQYTFRVTSTGREDSYPTTVTTGAQITVDSCAPVLANAIATPTNDKGFIQFNFTGISDVHAMSPISAVCIKRNSTSAPLETDSCWRSLAALRIAPTTAPASVPVSFFAGKIAHMSTYSVWVMDQAKNITTLKSDTKDTVVNHPRTCTGSACLLDITQAITANASTALSALTPKTGDPTSSSVLDPGYFVITSLGHLIYRDAATNTIRRIKLLSDTAASVLIANNATPVDGNESTARVAAPARIALDFEENLYILDHDRIRKVVFASDSQFTVTTIAGSGVDNINPNIADPLSLRIEPFTRSTADGASLYWYGTFNVLQSGKIYFSNDNPQRVLDPSVLSHAQLKIYDPKGIDFKVTRQEFSGSGVYGDSVKNTALLFPYSNFGFMLDAFNKAVSYVTARLCESAITCSDHDSGVFDITSGLSLGSTGQLPLPSQWSNGTYFNSRNGDLYHMSTVTGEIKKANRTSFVWNSLAGNGTSGPGFCVDGTSAQSCGIRLWDSYVGNNDFVFFIDQGRLRFIDLDGKIRTLTHE